MHVKNYIFPIFLCISFLCIQISVYAQKINYEAKRMQKKKGSQVIRLENEVKLTQGDMVVNCDHADFNPKKNNFDAWGNIHVIQGDSTDIFSEKLNYNGESRKGEFRENVKIVSTQDTLTTDHFDFNNKENSGYFFNGGKIVDSAATLESRTGYYYPDKNVHVFQDSVVVYNDDYTLYSDTLQFHTIDKKAHVFGPTEIIGDSSYIYCESGWYDTRNNIAQLGDDAYVFRKNQKLTGDSMYFNQEKGMGKAWGNVVMRDTSEDAVMKGNYGIYKKEPERAMLTDSALLIDGSNPDDSLYLHADTIRAISDSSGNNRTFFAYNKAQIFKSDFQARSDSITYSNADSTIHLFESPIMWSGISQITADSAFVYLENNSIDYVDLLGTPLIVMQEGENRYNQITGSKIKGFFKDGTLRKLKAMDGAKSIYYAHEEKKIIGINIAESQIMSLLFGNNNKVSRVMFHSKPKATLYPMSEIKKEDKLLDIFEWHSTLRPLSKYEIFIWGEKRNN